MTASAKVGRPRVDLVGREFGLLTVLSYSGIDKTKNSVWLCKCACGNVVDKLGLNLMAGRTKTCARADHENCLAAVLSTCKIPLILGQK